MVISVSWEYAIGTDLYSQDKGINKTLVVLCRREEERKSEADVEILMPRVTTTILR